jgi:release factor glutamine methyltransferase
MMSKARSERLRAWHDDASAVLHRLGEHHTTYLGLDLVVPEHVFPPAPMSELLGRCVVDEADPRDRVLDMGTGCGVNALLAARNARDVTGVDINPHAVAAATANALRNGLADRTTFVVGDLFEAVDGAFDLVIFDPPFRWFRPADLLDAAITDEGYDTLRRFMGGIDRWLTPNGRVLLFFGSSGDLSYLHHLMERSSLSATTLASRDLHKDGLDVTYHTFRLTR